MTTFAHPVVTTELTVFARLLRAYGSLRRLLETRLLAEHALTINDFETLLHLSQAPEQSLRRVDLAERLVLSPSGVTRLLDGLEACGLVEKASCETDARVTYAVLTQDGRARLDAAWATHAEVLSDALGGTLAEAELALLAGLLSRLPGVGDAGGEACLAGDRPG